MPNWCAAFFFLTVADMAPIPAGDYLRGRNFPWSDYDVAWYPNPAKDDTPARPLKIAAFSIDVAEVTNVRYQSFVKATARPAPYHWKQAQPAAAKVKVLARPASNGVRTFSGAPSVTPSIAGKHE